MISIESNKLRHVVCDILSTQSVEIECDACFTLLDRYAEMVLMGKDAASAMPLVATHLDHCGACREEYEALLSALRAFS